MKQPTESKCRKCYKAEEHIKRMSRYTQHLCILNTILDTIRWLVTSTGEYVNIGGFRSLTGTMNIYLEVS